MKRLFLFAVSLLFSGHIFALDEFDTNAVKEFIRYNFGLDEGYLALVVKKRPAALKEKYGAADTLAAIQDLLKDPMKLPSKTSAINEFLTDKDLGFSPKNAWQPGATYSSNILTAAITKNIPFANRNRELEFFIWLLNNVKGINPNAQNEVGRTPLHYAALFRQSSYVDALVDHGADVTIQDQDGNTPLHILIENNKREALSDLFKARMDEQLLNLAAQFNPDLTLVNKKGDRLLDGVLSALQNLKSAPREWLDESAWQAFEKNLPILEQEVTRAQDKLKKPVAESGEPKDLMIAVESLAQALVDLKGQL